MSVLSFVAHKILFLTLAWIIKCKLSDDCCKECECFKQENIEKVYVKVYDMINLKLDKVRKIVLLHDIPSLVRVKYF
jgi:hypothetical protein